MSIASYSFADLGYRQLGPLPKSGGGDGREVARLVTQHCPDYEAVSDTWVRLRGRRKGGRPLECLRIVDVLDAHARLDDERLGFVAEHFRSEYAKLLHEQHYAPLDVLLDAATDGTTNDLRWRGMYRLGQSLFFANESQMRRLLREHVAPWFFQTYPKGKVAVLRHDVRYDSLLTVLRAVYTAAQTPLAQLKAAGVDSFPTLRQWQATFSVSAASVWLEFFNHLWYPCILGYQAGPPGLAFVFLFDPPERHEPSLFPQDWLAIPRSHAGFGQERVDGIELMTEPRGATAQRAAHRRYLHPHGFTAADNLELLQWYVGKVNRLLVELADAANFTEGGKPETPIDPVAAFEHYLTVDRLVRKTLATVAVNEVSAAKGNVFEVAEIYDGLRWLFTGEPKTAFFKTLFNTQDGPALIGPYLEQAPAPFGGYLRGVADLVYADTEKTILDSVWYKSKVTPSGILVRGRAPGAPEALEPGPVFVANLMRAYRNAHHGYFTAADEGKRPSRYLFLVDGNVPDAVTALPVLWLLAYLVSPDLVGWRPLPVDAFP